MHGYDHRAIEKKWQEKWATQGLYRTNDREPGKENYFCLVEYPYPSGNLHIGHWYAFAVPDIFARYKRMAGYNVLFPIGFDSFGLPAENAAIKHGLDPKKWTNENIAHMSEQLRSMGNMFDWERKVVASDPSYYHWTQALFLKLYEAGLAYRSTELANWCPKDLTVLANEQVKDGKCERCGTEVEKREQASWFLKITDYAERLLADLDNLDWPEEIKESQRNWIGKSEGAKLRFEVKKKNEIGKTKSIKEKVVILHGWSGTPESNWIPRLTKELEAKGHEVIAPLMAHASEEGTPEEDSVRQALAATEYDENTVIIGFSLGAVVALKVLERLNDPVKHTVFVAGFVDAEFGDKRRPFESTYSWDFDEALIRNHSTAFTILHDRNDEAVTHEQAERLSRLVDTEVTSVEANEPHFVAKEEPEVLNAALSALEQNREDRCRDETSPKNWHDFTSEGEVEVFTTRPDTLFGATYLVLAPEHELVAEWLKDGSIENTDETLRYIERSRQMKDIERTAEGREKTGVRLVGVTAINPANQEEIPVFIADYVLAHYGTGAIMAVPAHDERDWEFAQKFSLPIKQVIAHHFEIDCQGAPRDDVETLERRTVDLIIQHPDGNHFLLQREMDGDYAVEHLVGGGVEGELDEEAVRRELMEETGYKNFDVVGKVGETISIFGYRHTKQKNQQCMGDFWHVKLRDLEQGTSEVDEGIHELEWVTKEEMTSRILWSSHQYGWNQFLDRTPYTGNGVLIDSGEFDGMDSNDAKSAITEHVGGEMTATYRLRDWSLSRQRYWGCPIPIVYDPEGKPHAVPEEHLPWTLPEDVDFTPTGKAPLATSKELFERTERIFGKGWTPEVDTFDTFVDSSWYYLRYADAKNEEEFASRDKLDSWLPVDRYSGGAEHTTMHVLYSRFWHKALFDLGLVPASEPYKERMNRGQILGPDGKKMSKSKGNVVDPDEHVERVGADTVKMYLAFMGPYNVPGNYPFDLGGIAGMRRFLERVVRLSERIAPLSRFHLDNGTERLVHQSIKKIGEDVDAYKFNTAISQLMILLNHLEKLEHVPEEVFHSYLRLIAPFAPHLAEELWEGAGKNTFIHLEAWPTYDETKLAATEITIVVQINGKVRASFTADPDISKDKAISEALMHPTIVERLAGAVPQKTIFVPGKLVNLVVPANT